MEFFILQISLLKILYVAASLRSILIDLRLYCKKKKYKKISQLENFEYYIRIATVVCVLEEIANI